MNIFNRLKSATFAFFGESKTVATLMPTWAEGRPVDKEVNFEQIVKEGWRKNELMFACINKTANTASQVNLLITKGKKAQDNHPLKILIDRPNPFMSQFDLWYAILAFQKLSGWAVFEKERSGAGKVVALWPLRPDWLKELPSSTKVIGGYKYEPPGLTAQFIPTEDVLAFRLFDPLGMFHHWPPVAVASRVGTVDNRTTDYIDKFFIEGGIPPGILKTRMKLNDAIVTDIRRRWSERYGGMSNWMAPAVLDSDAEYQKVGLDFREMGFEVLDARNEARICMVLDVPPIMVSANIGLLRSTFSNYREARLAWWQDSLVPLYKNLKDTLVTGFTDDFGDIETEWDFSSVPALQEELNARWDRAIKAFMAGAITINTFNAQIGLPDLGLNGEVFVRQLSLIEVPARPGITPFELEGENGDTGDEDVEGDGQETPFPVGSEEEVAYLLGMEAKQRQNGDLEDVEVNTERDVLGYFKKSRKRVEKELAKTYGA